MCSSNVKIRELYSWTRAPWYGVAHSCLVVKGQEGYRPRVAVTGGPISQSPQYGGVGQSSTLNKALENHRKWIIFILFDREQIPFFEKMKNRL